MRAPPCPPLTPCTSFTPCCRTTHARRFPPHATTLYQPLDKIFATFHHEYSKAGRAHKESTKEALQTAELWRGKALSKTNAINIMHKVIFSGWLGTKAANAAWRDCGMGDAGVDVETNPAIAKQLVPSTERMGPAERFYIELGKAKPDLAPLLLSPKKQPGENAEAYQQRRGDHYKRLLLESYARPRTLAEAGVLRNPLHCATTAQEAIQKLNDGEAKFGEGNLDEQIAKFELNKEAKEIKQQAKKEERDTNLPITWLLYLLRTFASPDPTLLLKPRLVELQSKLKDRNVPLQWQRVDKERRSGNIRVGDLKMMLTDTLFADIEPAILSDCIERTADETEHAEHLRGAWVAALGPAIELLVESAPAPPPMPPPAGDPPTAHVAQSIVQ